MMKLCILTLEKMLVKEEILSLSVIGKSGAMQILSGHMSMLAQTLSGPVTFVKALDNKEITLDVLEGIIQVQNDEVNLLCGIANELS